MLKIAWRKWSQIILLVIASFLCIFRVDAVTIADGWAKAEIEATVALGVMQGYPDQNFYAEKNITRAELTVVLTRMLDVNALSKELMKTETQFKDVPVTHWATGEVQLLYEMGYVKGYSNSSFLPKKNVTREELAAFFARILTSYNDVGQQRAIADETALASWSSYGVQRMVDLGVLILNKEQMFLPKVAATRADVAYGALQVLSLLGKNYHLAGEVLSYDRINGKLKLFVQGETCTITLESGYLVRGLVNKFAKVLLSPDGKGLQVEFTKDFVNVQIRELLTAKTIQSTQEEQTAGKLSMDLPQENNSYSKAEIQKGIALNKSILGTDTFAKANGVDGKGQLVAVLDSGIDLLHPDLQLTTDGKTKIKNVIDLTDEGLIERQGFLQFNATSMLYSAAGKNIELGSLISVSGKPAYGTLSEAKLGLDINLNGNKLDEFMVLFLDSKQAGKYDTVAIDTNQDFNFAQEKQIGNYATTKNKIAWQKGEKSFALCLTELWVSGLQAKLSFDGDGHGTKVAGIIGANGTLSGIAPGSQLLVIKIVDKNGQISWNNLEQGIKIAVEQGATIVNLSVGAYGRADFGSNSLNYLVDKYSQENKVYFAIAAGNEGPGLNSLATPGDAKSAFSVGAYISASMWRQNYGLNILSDSMWYYSSVGSRGDGYIAPTIVAPGSVITTVPTWQGSYLRTEGTSVATPHIAGALALILECAEKNQVRLSPELLKRAVINSARVMPNFSVYETGFGTLNIFGAWENTLKLSPYLYLRNSQQTNEFPHAYGIIAREYEPKTVAFEISNVGTKVRNLFWYSKDAWVKPNMNAMRIAGGAKRTLLVDYNLPAKPGIYATTLSGRMLDSYAPEVSIFSLAVQPYRFSFGQQNQSISESAPAAQYKRYYFAVEEGTTNLLLKLAVIKTSSYFQGRVRMQIFAPDGSSYAISDFTGLSFQDEKLGTLVEQNILRPQAGAWEVVVYSSPMIAEFGLLKSDYQLTAEVGTITKPILSYNKHFIITFVENRDALMTEGFSLHLLNKATLKPVAGYVVINKKLYYIKNGWVSLPATARAEEYEVTLW
ncbi:MAG: S8 family serine peptidase [Clostridia bacterium]